jgi:hypothetical protein
MAAPLAAGSCWNEVKVQLSHKAPIEKPAGKLAGFSIGALDA